LRARAAPWTILELLHPVPSLLTTAAAVAFAMIFGLLVRDPKVGWIIAIMLLVQFSISALNDWADADLDAHTGRRRPIPLGLVPARSALIVAIACAAGALLGSVVSGFGLVAFLMVALGLASGWAYDLRLKRTPLSVLPFALAFPLLPLWTAVVAGRSLGSVSLVLLGGIPLAAAIHLADAIPDREADRGAGVNSLAVALGRPAAELVAAGLLLVGTLVSMIVLLDRAGSSALSLVIVAVAVAWFVLNLGTRNAGGRSASLVGKWVVIGAAGLAAIPLVVTASGR
jgi:4-hydroxybenzoate polyprenyltransferase